MTIDRVFIGVDPGKNGGLVALFGEEVTTTIHNEFKAQWLLSRIDFKTMPENNREILDWFKYTVGDRAARCCLEEVGGFIQGNPTPGSAMFNFGKSYGALEMALEASGFVENETFFRVRPQSWQAELDIPPRRKPTKKFPNVKEETEAQWKGRLKAKAFQVFPTCHFTNATADAALIAHYCYLMHS